MGHVHHPHQLHTSDTLCRAPHAPPNESCETHDCNLLMYPDNLLQVVLFRWVWKNCVLKASVEVHLVYSGVRALPSSNPWCVSHALPAIMISLLKSWLCCLRIAGAASAGATTIACPQFCLNHALVRHDSGLVVVLQSTVAGVHAGSPRSQHADAVNG